MRILLAISGGIAAYKSAELLRLLQKQGAEVTVLMTASAQKFVGALTFEALSKKAVYTDLFSGSDRGMAHIDLAKNHDILLVAPATASSLTKMAQGLADDLLGTVYLAFGGRVVLAPAMNTKMWQHPATHRNVALLQTDGAEIIAPESGELACGDEGEGKMASPEAICNHVLRHAARGPQSAKQPLRDKKILITAGATREYLDPVRFISSPATGQMGFAFASAAATLGAEVILVAANATSEVSATFPECISVSSTEEMWEVLGDHLDYDIFVSSAAVSDYRAGLVHEQKIKKQSEELNIQLTRNRDMLKSISLEKLPHQICVGFAAETENIEANAKAKLREKKLDYIIANEVYRDQKGFGVSGGDYLVVTPQTSFWYKDTSKAALAQLFWNMLLKDQEKKNESTSQ